MPQLLDEIDETVHEVSIMLGDFGKGVHGKIEGAESVCNVRCNVV